jgi:L-amino acid N-acyltransferase YncA
VVPEPDDISNPRPVRYRPSVPTTLRPAERADAEAIRAIYNVEVAGSTVTFDLVPRTLEDQVAWIEEHSGGHPAIVAVDETGAVTGFGSLSPYRERPAYFTTVEDSIYVNDAHRSTGVGFQMLSELVRMAQQYGYHSMIARIVGGHDASISLHRRCGFEVVGTEHEVGRKLGKWLDVVVMQRML